MIFSATIQDRIRKNSFIRLIAFPFLVISQKIRYEMYHRNIDISKMRELKGIYKGKRCFVVGNGPSLNGEDLDKINNEISFAFNRIFKIYSRTIWRPTYYMITDPSISNQFLIDDIPPIGSEVSFVSNHRLAKYWEKELNVQEIYVKGAQSIKKSSYYVRKISEDVTDYFTAAESVIIDAIELAFYMGFSEIYLLGVDHSFPVEVNNRGKRKTRTVQAHFAEDSYKGQFITNKDSLTKSFETINNYAKKNGVKIINSTRGGELDVFERIEIESIEGI